MSVSLKELCQMVNVPYDQARALIDSDSSDGESEEREEATVVDTVVHADCVGGLEGEEASQLASEQVQSDTEEAVKVMVYILRKMNQNDLAEQLENEYKQAAEEHEVALHDYTEISLRLKKKLKEDYQRILVDS
ncbi:hypothetical protein Q8A67_012500 [Cirrhinus molitorella]|uniref:Uncharacterized protein n=1 Tax=Cirrhinus molitorella TaxID=172907 RepID=A0AA88PPD1_9TELE|nr:hypothetical protein Q8A67_012500 [Cirrhinus molitorella]